MPTRQKHSCFLKIITKHGTMAEIEEAANNFASMAVVTHTDFKTLDQTPAEQAAMQIGRHQKETWAAFITERRLIDASCEEPPYNTVKSKLVPTRTDNLDELEPLVNKFAELHEVIRIDVAAKKAPGGRIWVATLSYGARLG